jgi:branched-chain amino acid transport system substrate-binding protein
MSLRLRVALLASAIAMASGPAPSGAADPFDIPMMSSQTGPIAFGGKLQLPGAKALEAYINRTGGIRGRPIRFVIVDEQSNPAVAVQAVSDLIAKHVPILLGPGTTSTCNAAAPVIKAAIVAFCTTPGAHPDAGSYMFASSFDTGALIAVGVRDLRLRGLKRIAMITTTDASGQDGERGVDAALADPANKDLTLVAREHYAAADLSVAAQIARIKAANPQAVVAWASGSPIGTFFRNAHEDGLDVPVMTSPNNQNQEQMAASAEFLPSELLVPTAPFATPEQITNQAQRAAVKAFYDGVAALGIQQPTTPTQTVWDPGLIIVSAYRKYGLDMTAAQAHEYIASLKGFVGINGPYDFQAFPQRGLGATAVVIRWDRGTKTWVAASKIGGAPL